ncbi:MAG: hypothetical protein AAGF44_04435, partial [Pseudomonadota bacterium]
FLESALTAEDVFAVEADHVCIATGATWRRDRFDGKAFVPIGEDVSTPDDIIEGRLPQGPTVVYDADTYYLAGVVAERIRQTGQKVTYVTASDSVSAWAGNTAERWRVRSHLMALGVEILTAHKLTGFDGNHATLVCTYSGAEINLPATGAVMVGQRLPNDALYHEILDEAGGDLAALPFTLKRIGDCEAPGIIAQNVYAGHRFATELEAEISMDEPLKHDRVDVGATPPAPMPETPEGASPAYLPTLLRYWEEEIAGEAFFRELAARAAETRHKEKMLLLAQVEQRTAEITEPLLRRYGLVPKSHEELRAEGLRDAEPLPREWEALIGYMADKFPEYIDDFKRLEAMAPAEDLPILAQMTDHEVVAVEFLERERRGDPTATEPLLRFICGPDRPPAETTRDKVA